MSVNGIACVKYRGSALGAGFASFDTRRDRRPAAHTLKAFVKDERTAKKVEVLFSANSLRVGESSLALPPQQQSGGERLGIWKARVETSDLNLLERVVDEVNTNLLSSGRIEGRIFSYGRHVDVFKEVGYPLEVARQYGLDTSALTADAWIAHTRQPTNSPGRYPIWSHPFASMDCAIVHNGDISSFGANMQLLNSWGLRSHVGTDSEVIARLIDHLIRTERLSIAEAARVLTNPFETDASEETLRLMQRYRGARLDGPFAVVAGICDGEDTYLLALADRSKFRPLLIGEDEERFYVASEENQIRSLSKNAKVWAPQPGSFFLASVARGMIETGTYRDVSSGSSVSPTRPAESGVPAFDAAGAEFHEINDFLRRAYRAGSGEARIQNLSGQRYLGIGFSTREEANFRREFKVELHGFPGNCLANLNDGVSFEVYGNVGDDLADTMHAGLVCVHGSVRDVAAQALQGGRVYIRGSVGNRAGIQMREYRDEKPCLIIGETADDYLGEYMAGGVLIVLNLGGSERPVGNFVATGIVGGMIYIRGRVDARQIGLPPQRDDIINYLRVCVTDGTLSESLFEGVSKLPYPGERELKEKLPESIYSRIRFLFYGTRYTKPISSAYRNLSSEEVESLRPRLEEFAAVFGISSPENILNSKFTVIKPNEPGIETPVPPQELPVQE